MGYMREDDAYDWVDDDNLDQAETLRRFNMLESVEVVAPEVAGLPSTTADKAATVVRTFYGPQQPSVASVL